MTRLIILLLRVNYNRASQRTGLDIPALQDVLHLTPNSICNVIFNQWQVYNLNSQEQHNSLSFNIFLPWVHDEVKLNK